MGTTGQKQVRERKARRRSAQARGWIDAAVRAMAEAGGDVSEAARIMNISASYAYALKSRHPEIAAACAEARAAAVR